MTVAARWPHIRAALIALAIAFGLIDGLPLPPSDDTPAWERGFVEDVRAVQEVAMWPMRWVRPRLRIAQRWALYQAPGTERWRMWIEGRHGGQWEIMYRAGDPDHADYHALIENGRVRGIWDIASKPPVELDAWADWITARVLDDHPDFTGARMRMEKVRLGPGGITTLGQFAHIHMRERGAPR